MAKIASLLNPVPNHKDASQSPSGRGASLNPSIPSPISLASPPPKKQKFAKDAAIFTKDPVRGEIRYAPFEEYSEECRQELLRCRLFPLGQIGEFHRHIPYSSGKKKFTERTGRDAFEVFQYTFVRPETGSEKEWLVMWDYNIGLVRITPFFKCQGYGKTVPSRVIKDNDGLEPLCHSITGGALAAQGYWMPYDAARAMASTFCHAIRYLLVPIFGPDFPGECVPPTDEGFPKMTIDPRIVRVCGQEAQEYREAAVRHASRARASQTATPRLQPMAPSGWSMNYDGAAQTPSRLGSESPSDPADYSSTVADCGGYRHRKLPTPLPLALCVPSPRSTPDDIGLPTSNDAILKAAREAHRRTADRSCSELGYNAVSPTTDPRKLRRGAVSEERQRAHAHGHGHGPQPQALSLDRSPRETSAGATQAADAQIQAGLPCLLPTRGDPMEWDPASCLTSDVLPSLLTLVDNGLSMADLRAAYTLCRLGYRSSGAIRKLAQPRKRRWSSASWL